MIGFRYKKPELRPVAAVYTWPVRGLEHLGIRKPHQHGLALKLRLGACQLPSIPAVIESVPVGHIRVGEVPGQVGAFTDQGKGIVGTRVSLQPWCLDAHVGNVLDHVPEQANDTGHILGTEITLKP